MATSNLPRISVGMFVYNGGESISQAITSILSQTFKEFELIISDNASTDETDAICREFAAKDTRIRYIRQERNLGAEANCLFVLDAAVGEYFMWAAHDDVRSPEYLEVNLEYLSAHPDYVASTSPVQFMGGRPDSFKMGDRSLDQENAEERFLAGLETWRACGRFYSLMKRDAVASSKMIRSGSYIGADIAFVLELSLQGKFRRVEQGYVELGRHGVSGSGNIYRKYRSSALNWFVPFLELDKKLLELSSNFSTKGRLMIIKVIVVMNVISFLHQIKTEIMRRLG